MRLLSWRIVPSEAHFVSAPGLNLNILRSIQSHLAIVCCCGLQHHVPLWFCADRLGWRRKFTEGQGVLTFFWELKLQCERCEESCVPLLVFWDETLCRKSYISGLQEIWERVWPFIYLFGVHLYATWPASNLLRDVGEMQRFHLWGLVFFGESSSAGLACMTREWKRPATRLFGLSIACSVKMLVQICTAQHLWRSCAQVCGASIHCACVWNYQLLFCHSHLERHGAVCFMKARYCNELLVNWGVKQG